MEKRNVAARAGRWSATHRKTAIFGWLGFVVLAVMVSNVVAQKTIHGADQFSGESHRAEQALHDSGLRPNDENVLVQSQTLTIRDPEFRSAVEQASSELSKTQDVENVVTPITGDAPVSADGHSALVQFEITGDDLEARDRLDPANDVVASVQDQHPQLRVEQFGSASTQKELNEIFSSDLLQAETLSFPLTMLILIVAFGALVAPCRRVAILVVGRQSHHAAALAVDRARGWGPSGAGHPGAQHEECEYRTRRPAPAPRADPDL
jgi:RND superfamily putative drug exporter